jgi:hypothetical protein
MALIDWKAEASGPFQATPDNLYFATEELDGVRARAVAALERVRSLESRNARGASGRPIALIQTETGSVSLTRRRCFRDAVRATSIRPSGTCKSSFGPGKDPGSALDRGVPSEHDEHVTSDVEHPASQAPNRARPNKQPTAEEKMRTTIIKSVAVSVPVAIVVFVGMIAFAVPNEQPEWNAWLSMAVGIGFLAGVFFGLLAGFMRTSHLFK